MLRAYWATANVGPYREFQVVVFDDASEPDAGWIRTGWFREIVNPPKVIILTAEQEAELMRLYQGGRSTRRGRPRRKE